MPEGQIRSRAGESLHFHRPALSAEQIKHLSAPAMIIRARPVDAENNGQSREQERAIPPASAGGRNRTFE
jgi:hypothetical protein